MNIDELSGQELDALAATSVMGWHRDYCGNWAWGEHSGGMFVDFSGPSIFNWRPSSGKKLSAAASDVLLKALGDGLVICLNTLGRGEHKSFLVLAEPRHQHGIVEGRFDAIAPTLPVALERAICKAVVKP